MRDPRLEKLADVLVNYSVRVKKDQVVRISGPPVAQPLIVPLYRSVLAAGGHPIVRVAPDEVQELLLKHGTDEQLRFVNPITAFEYERIDSTPSRTLRQKASASEAPGRRHAIPTTATSVDGLDVGCAADIR